MTELPPDLAAFALRLDAQPEPAPEGAHSQLGVTVDTEVDLVILLHVDGRTELRVEAPGYEP